ncbi:MAG: hypothetical protein ABIO70_32875 [Pseudomonadota bacterium]
MGEAWTGYRGAMKVVVLPLLLMACQGPGSSWGSRGRRDTNDGYLPPPIAGEDVAVTLVEDPEAAWACADAATACSADYLAFPGLAAAYAHPISAATLAAELGAIEEGEVEVQSPEEVSDSTLASTLASALNMDFLLEGLDERALTITVAEDDGSEQRLLFTDPWVGTFQARLLLPEGGPQPWPGVLSLHGHGGSAEGVLDELFGREYPAHGYALATLDFRVMGADPDEDEVVRALLRHGFTLEALRIYESLLVLKYLRWLPEVDAERLAVVGHSGGSVAWNLAIRGSPPIVAYVSDLTSSYYDPWKGWLLDDTIPALYPVHPALNELEGAGPPVLRVDYGYQHEFDEILTFLQDHL